jgi:hypothetical protein
MALGASAKVLLRGIPMSDRIPSGNMLSRVRIEDVVPRIAASRHKGEQSDRQQCADKGVRSYL